MAPGRWKALTICALFLFSFQTVAQGQGKASLIGAWQSAGPAGPINLVFESKNRLVFDGEPAKYTLTPGVLRVDDGEEVVDYPYILAGDVLTITFPEGFKMQFKRSKSAPGPTVKNESEGSSSAGVESSRLASEISGIWWGYSGSTERKIGLCPNGRYEDYSESSYSGSSRDSLGNPSTGWGSASQRGGSGTWAINGSYQEGIISVRYSNGNTATIRYRQVGEPGCLLFNYLPVGANSCRPQSSFCSDWLIWGQLQLQFHRFQISMSRKANPLDNAYAESFIKTLKSEEVYLWEYRTIEDVQRRIPYFIEDVYNQKRLHSALGYCPLSEFENMITTASNPSRSTLILAI